MKTRLVGKGGEKMRCYAVAGVSRYGRSRYDINFFPPRNHFPPFNTHIGNSTASTYLQASW